jgi:hypothetical protein
VKKKSAPLIVLLLFTAFFASAPARADGPPPVQDVPDLNYVNVLHALMHLGKFKTDGVEYLDAYSMTAHCDVVKGSYTNEFRWNEAREAIKKWIALKGPHLPTRLGVRSQIMFSRYDVPSKYYLFSEETPIRKINTFNTNTRPNVAPCDKPAVQLLPNKFEVITNNPLTLPGLRLSEDQAKDLYQKFEQSGNTHKVAYIRFNIDILDSDYLGPSFFGRKGQSVSDPTWKVKATLNSVEFFSDPEYHNRFYYFVPF